MINGSLFAELSVLSKDIWRVFGVKLPLLLSLMVIVAIGEGIGMALLLPLLSSIGMDGMSNSGPIVEMLTVLMSVLGEDPSIFEILFLIVFVLLLIGLLNLWQVWLMADFQRRYGARWQKKLFSDFIKAKWSFFSEQKLGDMVNAITAESARLAGAFSVLAQLVATLVVTIVYLFIAFTVSSMATLSLFIFGGVLLFSVKGALKKNHLIGKNLSNLNGELNVQLSEFLGGAKLIKALSTEEKSIRSVNEVVEELRVNNTWANFLPNLVKVLFEFLSLIALCLLLVFGFKYFDIPAAQVLLIIALFVRLLPRFNALQQNLQLISSYIPAITKVNSILDRASYYKELSPLVDDVEIPKNKQLSVHIMDAGYTDTKILRDVEIIFPAKGLIGIVGDSGSGKSTLINTILGLCELREGDIRIGNTSINDVFTSQWRKAIGYVPQDSTFFHKSIFENIAWGADDASLGEVRDAASRAHADGFINATPEKYATVIGDQGSRLSGGQKQRLSIARALITKPNLLLLDEATSALDSISEESVLQTIDELRDEICIVSVAHRLSSIRSADCIHVMDAGKVVESGNWDELIKKRGQLYNLALAQGLV